MDLKIEISGHQDGDLETALEEVLKKVRGGYTSGFDSNDTGSYSFEVTGSPVENYALAKGGDANKVSEDRYDRFEEAKEACEQGDQVVGLRDDGEVLTRSE